MPEIRRPKDPTVGGRVEVIERTTPFSGYFQVDRFRLRHRKFDGGWTSEMSREVFERGHAAAVLPYDPRRDEVVLIEQFRIGAYCADLEPWLVESVAGIIGPGENPEEVVRREAIEEADCRITDLAPIGTFLLTPGAGSETLALFCGRTESGGLGGVHGLPEEGEDIKVTVVPASEAIERASGGKIANANAVIPLLWLGLNRERLRSEWAP